jgi:hypothetical protein
MRAAQLAKTAAARPSCAKTLSESRRRPGTADFFSTMTSAG